MEKDKIKEITRQLVSIIPNIRNIVKMPIKVEFDGEFNRNQYYILLTLYKKGTLTMSALAQFVRVSNQLLTALVNELEQRQYVVRTTKPNNRRSIEIDITEKGKTAFKNYSQEIIDELSLGLESLSDEDLLKIMEYAQGINEILSK
ncbi:MAG: MarR family transcriptional regulator [Clostridia bacterium]|nr:MarR family transcriptional regulator [Clostridia bacterium]